VFIALSALIAAKTYSMDSKQRRRIRALDLTRDLLGTPEWREAVRIATEPGTSGLSLAGLPEEKRAIIFHVLNQIEIIAISMRVGDVDEEMLEGIVRTTVLLLWNALENKIAAERQTRFNPNIWSNFEWLAARWRSQRVH